jgi:hypothetical protein
MYEEFRKVVKLESNLKNKFCEAMNLGLLSNVKF